MKSLFYSFVLLFPLIFFGCSLIELDDEDPPPAFLEAYEYSHYIFCRGVVREQATNSPISGMRLRINKMVSTGFLGPTYPDSVCETTTNENGEYFVKFWYEKNKSYQLMAISDSTLLPNPNYIPVKGFTWFFTQGEVYDMDNQKYDLNIGKHDTITLDPMIPGRAYVTLRLKQKSGFDEPFFYRILVNKDTVRTFMAFPELSSASFQQMLILGGNTPCSVEIQLFRTLQSDLFLTKTITPLPTKLIVEEFEF